MNKNCVILQIELNGTFVCLDGQSYDTQGGTLYTEDEAAARIDELNRENCNIRYLVVNL